MVQAADRIARQTAIRARAMAEFAACRPAGADRAQGEPGAMSPQRWAARPEILRTVSEWATQEVVIALSVSAAAAEKRMLTELTLNRPQRHHHRHHPAPLLSQSPPHQGAGRQIPGVSGDRPPSRRCRPLSGRVIRAGSRAPPW